MTIDDDARHDIGARVGKLTLEEKVAVLSGQDSWSTLPLPGIGLRSMVMSDGPSGVRGATWDERDPSLLLPSALTLAASWDLALARRYGAVAAAEARRKGVDVILGPMINLARSPLFGRNFECFGEDPLLTADLAAAYVHGVQEHGVAATPKSYVGNDFETDRYTASAEVDDRTLREIYLAAFEKSVVDAGAWVVMSAYNSVNGVTLTENVLLDEPLTGSWGFDGVVVSDWTAVRSVESARREQHLVMPGPGTAWAQHLVDAVRRGDIDEAAVDAKVARVLLLAARVGALEGYPAMPVGEVENGRAFARHAAAEGMVLLRNKEIGAAPLLPLAAERTRTVAVIGQLALRPRAQGGGSATVLPEHVVGPLEGLRAALPDSIVLQHHLGAIAVDGFDPFDPALMRNPVTGKPGAHVRYLDADGAEFVAEERFESLIVDFGGESAKPELVSLTFATTYTPDITATVPLGFASPGTGRFYLDGELRLEETIDPHGVDQVQSFFFPPSVTTPVELTAGVPVELYFEFEPGAIVDGVDHSFTVTFGSEPPRLDADTLIRDAARAAHAADVAIVVVGTSAQVESEGYDRTDLRLPGRQDDLVAAVAQANPRTVVVVNAGAPVELPWRDDVGAIVVSWFGGQELGHALADVLFGDAEPGGRLPITWPDTLASTPVVNVTPVDGVVTYDEGVHIGYRAWAREDRNPAYPFGFGLGYTRWSIGDPAVEHADGVAVQVTVPVTNIGARPGKQVVQLYARRTESAVDRPTLWLVGFGQVRADAGESTRVEITVPRRAFAHWDGDWAYEPGEFELLAGLSAADLGSPVVTRL